MTPQGGNNPGAKLVNHDDDPVRVLRTDSRTVFVQFGYVFERVNAYSIIEAPHPLVPRVEILFDATASEFASKIPEGQAIFFKSI